MTAGPRVLLFTGKGGVGKTTVAAATAVRAARAGIKTLIVSTGRADSLAGALALPEQAAPGEPLEVETGLHVRQLDPGHRTTVSGHLIQRYLTPAVQAVGLQPSVASELAGELAAMPGVEDVLALLELRDLIRRGPYDLVVVDCAATAETMRLLSLPQTLAAQLHRALPMEHRLRRVVDPIGTAPGHDVVAEFDRLTAELADVHDVLAAERTSIRLVVTPEAVVQAETARTVTSLALFGYAVQQVVINRVFPQGSTDPWLAGWATAQQRVVSDIETSLAPVAAVQVPYLPAEPVGVAALAALQLPAEDPAEIHASPSSLAHRVEADGNRWVLVVPLPMAVPGQVQLGRRGDELSLTVAGRRRVVTLPSALRRCVTDGASVRKGAVRIRFTPDPDLWRPL